MFYTYFRGIGDKWVGRAIPHLDFGRSINERGQIEPPTLLLSYPAFVSFLCPCIIRAVDTLRFEALCWA